MIIADYLIVGGGVAGTTAAGVIRQHDAKASIIILSDEPYRLYSRIMLSKPAFFLGKIPFDQVFLKPESWYREQHIDFEAGHTVVALDTKRKVVTLADRSQVGYQKLLLALGSSVRHWTIPGADTPGVHYLRNLDDAKSIIADVKTSKRALVVGGGFVGFEMCDMLKLAGLETTLVIREPYFWSTMLDETSGRMIEAALEKGGVTIVRNTTVDEVLGGAHVQGVKLSTGATLPVDMIMVGIGTLCHVEWVIKAGIAGDRDIHADEYLATSAPDVWTAGDVTEYHDVILNENVQFGNWSNAQIQGRIAALNMLGQKTPFKLVSFYTAQGFGLAIAFVGDVRLREGTTAITRGSAEANSYGRIILKNDHVVGATMVNRTQDLMPLTKIIERGISMQPYRQQLANPSFDLKNVITAAP